MKFRISISTIIFLLAFNLSYSPEITNEDSVLVNYEQLVPGINLNSMRNTHGIIQGGMKKTASGTLKVLVVFVRFADDQTNTQYWPNYNVLPDWAANLVDAEVPANGIYTNVNLSSYFDMASGGDGNGNLGEFQMIGDVYYISTDQPRSAYTTDASTASHVFAKLDDPSGPYNIDFREYDNWRFVKNGENYNHEFIPFDPLSQTGGDGKVDHIFLFFRDSSLTVAPDKGGYSTLPTTFSTNDGVDINSADGSTQFYAKDRGPFLQDRRAVIACAHEYGHHLFGTINSNYGSHFDRSDLNEGNVHCFFLMTNSEAQNMSAYERYRLGWIDITFVNSNQSYVSINDTHTTGEAVMIPIRYDQNNYLREYYLIENFHTTNSYSNANPFIFTRLFNHDFYYGLVVYHIENEDLDWPTQSSIDLECADGRWGLAFSSRS